MSSEAEIAALAAEVQRTGAHVVGAIHDLTTAVEIGIKLAAVVVKAKLPHHSDKVEALLVELSGGV